MAGVCHPVIIKPYPVSDQKRYVFRSMAVSDQIFLSFPKIRKRQEFDENIAAHDLNLDEF